MTTLEALVLSTVAERRAKARPTRDLGISLSERQRDLRVRFINAFGADLAADLNDGAVAGRGTTFPVLVGACGNRTFDIAHRVLANVDEWVVLACGQRRTVIGYCGAAQGDLREHLLFAIAEVCA